MNDELIQLEHNDSRRLFFDVTQTHFPFSHNVKESWKSLKCKIGRQNDTYPLSEMNLP